MGFVLEEITDVHGIARALNVAVRTVNRYSAVPDGLPYMVLGKRRLYHLPTVRDWLLRGMKTPNPRRAA